MNSLPLASQLELALQRRGKERMELILLSSRAQSLVRMLPEEELYLTIKEAGEEESLPLLAMADHRQRTYIFDLEFWADQALDPERFFRWLDLLRQADEDQLRDWLKRADPELLLVILQKAVRVYVTDPDDLGAEPWREKELFTLDEQYYFELIDDRHRAIIERILSHLRDIEQEKFYAIIDDVRMEVGAETEDAALRVRQGRLEDHGFYTFNEAFRIYQYLDPGKLKDLEKHPERPGHNPEPAPRYALALAEKIPRLLALALKELSLAELEDFHHQFARLANKVMTADALDLSELSSLRTAIEKVYGYLEIGLEYWAEGGLPKAVRLLKTQWLEHIFQAGFSQVLWLSKRAQRIKQSDWFQFLKEPFHLFGDPDGKRIQALVLSRPKFYSGEKENELMEFKSLNEVRLAQESVDRAEGWLHLVFEGLGLTREKLREVISLYPLELSFKVILATALVNGAIKIGPQILPLTPKELSDFIASAMTPAEPPRKIDERLKDNFITWLLSHIPASKVKEDLARELALSAIISIEEELGLIKEPDNISPRYITSVIMQPEAPGG